MQHKRVLVRSLAAAAALTLTAPVALHAQYAPPPPGYAYPPPQPQYAVPSTPPVPQAPQVPQQQAAPAYDQAQVDQLVAPIALYPDQLLGQILMAATYPLEVVEAQRWVQDPNNAALRGDALAQALAQQDWDPSVKSLVPFPSVLQMMSGQLQWTQNLGNAFLAQQGDVMDSVQRLRHDAWNAGRLQSTSQQVVTSNGPDIVIEPADANTVYVPYYDPNVVYGAWPYPDEPPYYFAPPPGYIYGPVVAGIGFGVGYGVFGPFWGWDSFDWRSHRVHIDHDRFRDMDRSHRDVGDTWQHDPAHRRGVAYQDAVTQQRFTRANVTPDANRGNAAVTNRGIITPGTTQTTVAPATHGPMILRGGPAQTGIQGQPQAADPRFRGQVGTQAVAPQGGTVPQGRAVTPQYQPVQPHVVTPTPTQNQNQNQNRNQNGGG